MRLILARHGQSVSNVDPTYPGDDAPLTELGEQQADLLGKWLNDHESDIDLIVCSPLRRAFNTAQIINQYLNVEVRVEDALRELSQWEIDSLPRRTHPLRGETLIEATGDDAYYERYQRRVKTVLDSLTVDPKRPTPILVVSHGGTGGTLLRLILERHDVRFHTHNTAMHWVEWKDGHWIISGVNAVPHLPRDMWT